jgi:hypothetical protein
VVEVIEAAEAIVPVFIFSLPRSGSTLLQRILATHPAVATASEPWLLLPFLYARRRDGIYAEYNHRKANKAIDDFVGGIPGGEAAYRAAVSELAVRLYRERAGPGARYFVDKTPRYHVISTEIVRTFKDARFIFLWRNPLAVVSSMIEVWGRGRWNAYEFEFDLFDGLEALVDARKRAGDRALSLRYRDLVAESAEARSQVFGYLGLDIEDARPEDQHHVQLAGQMGDQVGARAYRDLSQEPRQKWTRTLASPLRKYWCRRYLRWIGRDRLEVMGYDLDALLRELDGAPTAWHTVPSDIVRMFFGFFVRIGEPWIVRDKLASARLGVRNRAHA